MAQRGNYTVTKDHSIGPWAGKVVDAKNDPRNRTLKVLLDDGTEAVAKVEVIQPLGPDL